MVLSGLPATGKSAVADGIARSRRSVVLSVDPIESAIVAAGISARFETGLAAYLVAEAIAAHQPGLGLDVVVDAVNGVEPARDQWRRLAARTSSRLRVIECVVTDEAVHRERLERRDRGLDIPEPSWESVEQRRAEWSPWTEEVLILDGLDPIGRIVERAIRWVEG